MNKMEFENLSKEKVKMMKSKKGYTLSYNLVKYNSDSKITILIKDIDSKYTNYKVTSGCGCTTPKITDNKMNISYDTRRLGVFSKDVTLSAKNKETGKVEREIFTIKGNVIR